MSTASERLRTKKRIAGHNWKPVYIADVCDVQYGFPFASVRYTSNSADIRLLRGDNIQPGNLRWDEAKRWPTDLLGEVGQFQLRLDDIVLAMDRPWISAGLRQARVRPEDLPSLLVQRVARLRACTDIDTKYLGMIVSTSEFERHLTSTQTGAMAPHISGKDIASFRFWLPPLAEQRAIMEILDRADAAVRAADSLIERKIAYKKALAEDLLTGRRRFPGFPAPWRETKLSAFFAPKDDRAPTKTPLILSCSKVYGILPQSERFSKQLASVSNAHYKHIVPGDLVYDPMLLWDASIAFSEYDGIVSPAYETLTWTGDETGDRRFFKALFKSQTMRYVYTTISQGTNARRRKAPVTDFLKVSMKMPDVEEQRRIADILGALDQDMLLLRKQRDALNEQKKGLMQKLLTGEVRLKEFR